MRHQVGIDLGDLLGDQAVLHGAQAISVFLLVAGCHRSQPHEAAAGVAHVANVLLESAGGWRRAELAVDIDEDRDPLRTGDHVPDARDEGPRLEAADPDGVRFLWDTLVVHIDMPARPEPSRSIVESSGMGGAGYY